MASKKNKEISKKVIKQTVTKGNPSFFRKSAHHASQTAIVVLCATPAVRVFFVFDVREQQDEYQQEEKR